MSMVCTRVLSALAGVGLLATVAMADRVVLSGGPGYGGGAFNATITYEAGTGSPFAGNVVTKTFCIETQAYFNPGTQYYVQYAMSAVPGGGGASGGEDPISSSTAWLFAQAMNGTLQWDIGSGLTTFDINNSTHQRAVQEAIWQLEDEAWGSYSSATSTIGKIRDNIKTQATTGADGSYYGVMVMRLWDTRTGSPGNWSYSGNHQDQLVLVPLPSGAWAGLGMMAGVIGLAYLRRRRQIA